jgi:hypothetical protein
VEAALVGVDRELVAVVHRRRIDYGTVGERRRAQKVADGPMTDRVGVLHAKVRAQRLELDCVGHCTQYSVLVSGQQANWL